MVRIPCPGIPLNVHSRIAPLFTALIGEVDTARRLSGKSPLNSSGGYVNRDVRGRPGVKSNHSWGLAADFNAATNPMQNTLLTDMPHRMPEICEQWGFRWGGTYQGRKDPMHVEFMGTPAQADSFVKALTKPQLPFRKWIRRFPVAKPKNPYTYPRRVLKLGLVGNDVRWVQWQLGMARKSIDGQFGPITALAVRRYQQSHKLSIDGIIGSKTLASLSR